MRKVKLLTRPTSLLWGIILVAVFLRLYRFWELPPGLWLDEAFNGWDALRVLRDSHFPVFFAQNGGREPLFIYLQSVSIGIFGPEIWALRLPAVLIGILTVTIVYRLGRELSSDEQGEYIGVLAAAVLAVLYWHVNFSRLGLRAILLPATSALTIYFFWRGFQLSSNRYFVWAGIALGITFYTYLSARLLPFVLIGFVLSIVILSNFHKTGRLKPRRVLLGLGVTLGFSALIILPLAVHFYWYPEDLSGRSTVSLLRNGDPISSLQAIIPNIVRVLGGIVFSGDLNLRHNLPGRPVLDILFTIGLLQAVILCFRGFLAQPVHALLLMWLGVMLLPSILSDEAPHFIRMVGAIPPLVILVAKGLVSLWNKFVPQVSPSLLIVGVMVLGIVGVLRDYFQEWATKLEKNSEPFQTNLVTYAQYINTLSENADVLIPLYLYGNPSVQFILARHFANVEGWSSELSKPLVIATTQRTDSTLWVILHRDVDNRGTVYFLHKVVGLADQQQEPTLEINDARGKRIGSVIPLKESAKKMLRPPTPHYLIGANFGNLFWLVGYDLDQSRVKPGQTIELALYWQPQENLDRDYRVFVHLVNPNGAVVTQWNTEPMFGYYTTGLWRRGAIVTDLFPIRIPPDVLPGIYRFEIGWVSFGDERLELLDLNGQAIDDKLIFGEIHVEK